MKPSNDRTPAATSECTLRVNALGERRKSKRLHIQFAICVGNGHETPSVFEFGSALNISERGALVRLRTLAATPAPGARRTLRWNLRSDGSLSNVTAEVIWVQADGTMGFRFLEAPPDLQLWFQRVSGQEPLRPQQNMSEPLDAGRDLAERTASRAAPWWLIAALHMSEPLDAARDSSERLAVDLERELANPFATATPSDTDVAPNGSGVPDAESTPMLQAELVPTAAPQPSIHDQDKQSSRGIHVTPSLKRQEGGNTSVAALSGSFPTVMKETVTRGPNERSKERHRFWPWATDSSPTPSDLSILREMIAKGAASTGGKVLITVIAATVLLAVGAFLWTLAQSAADHNSREVIAQAASNPTGSPEPLASAEHGGIGHDFAEALGPARPKAESEAITKATSDQGVGLAPTLPAEAAKKDSDTVPVQNEAQNSVVPQPERHEVIPAKLVRYTRPQLPEQARSLHISGIVVVEVTIDSEGRIGEVKTVRGDELLVQAARQALAQWRYTPAQKDGNSIESRSQLAFAFPCRTPLPDRLIYCAAE